MLPLDALRFQDKLSFRLKELMDEGVGGSSGLESGPGDFVVGGFVAMGFGAARGPEGLCCCTGGSAAAGSGGTVKSAPVLERFKNDDSILLPFGTEDDKNGDIPDLCDPFLSAVNDSAELVASTAVGLSRLPVRCTELLLRRCCTMVRSSALPVVKKLVFDAVMGVVGVFAICLVGGGDRFLSEKPCSWSAAILAAVGVLSGPNVIGGSRSGCRFFLTCAAAFFSSSNFDEV